MISEQATAKQATTVDDVGSGFAAAGAVLTAAGIVRIICVNDNFTEIGTVDPSTVVAAVAGGKIDPSLVREVAEEVLGNDSGAYLATDDDPSSQAEWLREHQEEMTEAHWARLGSGAAEEPTEGTTAKDAQTLQLLQEFADSVGVEFIGLNLSSWNADGTSIIANEGCSLVLFDRNLQRDGAAEDYGEFLLRTTVESYEPEKVIAVLFTHSVTPEEEYASWQVLAQASPKHGDRVIVIAKARLRSDVMDFASELKFAILAPRLRRVAERIKEGFTKKAADAGARLLELSPHILHAVLVKSVAKEGAWGPDTLTSIASTYLRRGVEAYVRSDGQVCSDAASLREISLRSPDLHLPGGLVEEYAELNRARMFDDEAHINPLRLPVDTGDIFAFFDAEKSFDSQPVLTLWIVVAQRCDLAVRPSGKRNYEPQLMPLAHIVSGNSAETERVGGAAIGKFSLLATPLAECTASQVNLSDRAFVPSIALDACALNVDGVGRVDTKSTLDIAGLTPPWVKLAERHVERGSKAVKVFRELASNFPRLTTLTRRALVVSATGVSRELNGFNASIDLRHGVVTYGVRRVARLREPYSQDLMERAAGMASRIPLDAAVELDE